MSNAMVIFMLYTPCSETNHPLTFSFISVENVHIPPQKNFRECLGENKHSKDKKLDILCDW